MFVMKLFCINQLTRVRLSGLGGQCGGRAKASEAGGRAPPQPAALLSPFHGERLSNRAAAAALHAMR